MAYPYPIYPQGIPNYQYSPYYQQMQSPMASQVPQPQGQVQNSGFVSAQSVEEAYNWPVAPGNSLTFKIENEPYICVKTRSLSQLEKPQFDKYRLVKEEEQEKSPTHEIPKEKPVDLSMYALNADLEKTEEKIRALKAEFDDLKGIFEEKLQNTASKCRKEESV